MTRHTGIVLITVIAALFSGCESSDEDVSTSANATTSSTTTQAQASKPASSSNETSKPAPTQSNETSTPSATAGAALAADQVPFGALSWSFGGVKGGRAAHTSASISGLRMSKNSLGYSWSGDTLASWGLSNGDAGAYACLFVLRSDGKWVGGKFDWISTSRTSRGLENIYNGYGGWSLAGVPNPCSCAFVIVSGDGKKRTNVIGGSWSR